MEILSLDQDTLLGSVVTTMIYVLTAIEVGIMGGYFINALL